MMYVFNREDRTHFRDIFYGNSGAIHSADDTRIPRLAVLMSMTVDCNGGQKEKSDA